ncbi:hypothetical protein [Pseudomonas chlororaphis]|uniref:hypothetical protein n=1 Tax=Pseudomonas chlororaphis TaxID=587753 RepID=UPI0039E6AEBF
MSGLAAKVANLTQGAAIPYTLFEKDKISITLKLPSILKLKLGADEEYLTAPVLRNDSPYDVLSAAFSITLGTVPDTNSQQVIATAQWLNTDNLETNGVMSFTCGKVAAGKELQCEPVTTGYKKVQWQSTMTSGTGTEVLNHLTLDSIELGSIASEVFPDAGPTINVSSSN